MDRSDRAIALVPARHLMRVLQVMHGFPPSGTGGAELYAEALSTALVRAGHDVCVFARESVPDRPEFETRDQWRGACRVHWINNTFRSALRFEDTYDNARITEACGALVRDFAPDVAHVHHLTCLSTTILDVLAVAGIPTVLHLHDYWLLCHRGQLLDTSLRRCDGPGIEGCANCTGPEGAPARATYVGARAWRAVRRLLPRWVAVSVETRARSWIPTGSAASARERSRRRVIHMRQRFAGVAVAVAPSRHVRERFVAAGFPGDRIVVSEYGVSASRPAATRTEGPVRAGYLGALMASKAPHLIREALERLPPGSLEVRYFGAPAPYHGDTSYSAGILARLAHPAATVHGPLAHDEVPAALAGLDLLVFPSIWEETSGIGAREALAAGVPVVAARIGGIPEFVRHGINGLLFEPGDAEDLARQLRRLVDDRTLLDRLRSGISPVREIDDDVRETIARYESLCAQRRPPSRDMRIAAVVLNYQTPRETAHAVAWLLMSAPPLSHIVVVDNGDGRAVSEALGGSSRVEIVATGANLGFAGGSNAGIRVALERGADAVLLVNSDVAVPPTTTASLAAALDATTGIVGPVVRSRTSPALVLSAGIDFDPRTGRMLMRSAPAGSPAAAVSGCAMLVDRRVFERAGLLPEDYFFGFEDIAFCARARAHGFASVVAPEAAVYHEGGATMGASTDRLYYGARDHLRLAGETPSESRIHAAARQAAIVAYSFAHALTARGASLPSRLAAVGQGTVDFYRGRTGPRR